MRVSVSPPFLVGAVVAIQHMGDLVVFDDGYPARRGNDRREPLPSVPPTLQDFYWFYDNDHIRVSQHYLVGLNTITPMCNFRKLLDLLRLNIYGVHLSYDAAVRVARAWYCLVKADMCLGFTHFLQRCPRCNGIRCSRCRATNLYCQPCRCARFRFSRRLDQQRRGRVSVLRYY